MLSHLLSLPTLRFAAARFSLLIVFSILISSPAQSAEVPYLYQAEITVADQNLETRKRAIETALQIVLLRVTGDTDIANKPGVATMLAQPERYLTQFSYRQPATNNSSNSNPERILIIDFQRKAIEGRLTANNIVIWPAERPRILVWLTKEVPVGREWVRFGDEATAYSQLESAMKKRGLPFELPFLDLLDERHLPLEMAGGLIIDSILSASARYQADAVLAGRSYVNRKGILHTEWVLIADRTTKRYRTSSLPQDNPFDPVINHVADFFAAQYTPSQENGSAQASGQNRSGVSIKILSIKTVEQYAALMRYVEQLSGVKNVYPTHVTNEFTEFYIDTELKHQQFSNLLKLDKSLIPAPNQSISAEKPNYSSGSRRSPRQRATQFIWIPPHP